MNDRGHIDEPDKLKLKLKDLVRISAVTGLVFHLEVANGAVEVQQAA